MSSRFYKALALAIGFEAVMYLIGSIAGLTWRFYEWGADERKNK